MSQIESKTLYDPDEFLLTNIKDFHYEVMCEGEHVWIGIQFENGKTGHINVYLNDKRIHTSYEEWNENE